MEELGETPESEGHHSAVWVTVTYSQYLMEKKVCKYFWKQMILSPNHEFKSNTINLGKRSKEVALSHKCFMSI